MTPTTITAAAELAASRNLMGIVLFVVGFLLVAGLIGAFAWGMRNRREFSMPPREQPPPDEPHPGETEGHVHPAEVPHDGRRRMPYEIADQPSTTEEDHMAGEVDEEERRRENRGPGSSPAGD